MKKKALLSSLLTIALCFSLIAGSTYALFTSTSEINVAATSGTVSVQANILENTLETSSFDVPQAQGAFECGGVAEFDGDRKLNLVNIIPGDSAKFTIRVTNNSNVTVQYRVKWAVEGELAGALVATAGGSAIVNNTSDWELWQVPATEDEKVKDIEIVVSLPKEVTDEYQNKSASITFIVEAVQGNAIVEDVSSLAQLELALEYGNTATLASNIVLDADEALVIGEDTAAVIDLNGYTLTANKTKNGGAAIVNNGTLSIVGTNGGVLTNATENGAAVISNTGELTISGADIVGAPISGSSYPAYAIEATSGTVTVNEGTTVTSDRGVLGLEGDAVAVINGGTFTVTDAANYKTLTSHVIAAEENSELIIYGGSFESHYTGVSGASIIAPMGGSVTVYGGDFRDDVDSTDNFNNTANFQNYMGYSAPVLVYGGTFDDATVNKNVAPGYKAIMDENGIYSIAADDRKGMPNSSGEVIIVPEEVDTIVEGATAEEVKTAINAALAENKNVYIDAPGTYELPQALSGKEVTVAGSKDVIIDLSNATANLGNASVTFDGVTVKTTNTNYKGIQYADKVVYKNVTFEGGTFLYSDTEFYNCTFNLTTNYIWTYSAQNVLFDGCVFNTEGKAILAYHESGSYGGNNITVKDCTFNASKAAYTWDGQYVAAVEINTQLYTNTKISVAFEGNNTLNFTGSEADAKGNSGFNGFWRIKDETFAAGKQNLVVIDGKTVIADGLLRKDNELFVYSAQGLNSFNSLAASGQLTAKGAKLTLLDNVDMSGYTWTPVDSHADTNFYINEINGNGHTISNLTVSGQAMFTRFAGFGDVTVKNLTFDNATVTSGSINTAILVGHNYQNLLLDNVDVKNSSVTGGYKVATLVGTVYNENASTTVVATVKDCDIDNCTVTTTSYDFDTCGIIGFVYESDNDKVAFVNTTISNTTLRNTNSAGYDLHAFVYATSSEWYDEAPGVTVTNCTFVGENG